jgi:signal transduction histidine kinase
MGSMRSRWRAPLLTMLVGAALTTLVAVATSMTNRDALELVGIAAGVGGIAILLGVPLLRLVRTRNLGLQIATLTLVIVAAVGLGAVVAARAMFISDHDLAAIEVVLAAAATVGVTAAVWLGATVAATTSSLVAVTRRIGTGPGGNTPTVDGPPEFVRLARELDVMEQRLDDARRREQAVEQSRRELVAWVSHDLRTPLAAIRAMVEALEDGVVADPETVARYYSTLRAEADRLAALVDDLFELSRTQSGVIELQLERVSLSDLVSDAIAGVAPVAAAKGVRLEGRVDGARAEVAVSTPEVLRALRNVLENAIRHTPPDGSVTVVAGSESNEAYVSVVDSGGGIPEADLARIFDVGYQVDRARTAGSSGLGLAIARGFVEALHGDISAANEDGGARVTVRLPRAPVT